MKKNLEQTIREVSDLFYGSDKARDTYAKDTPGQTPGIEHDPIQHQHKPELAIDGVPEVGGMVKKPNLTATIKKEDLQYDLSEKEIGDILESVAEQMSPEQRKKAAAKIFQMHQDKRAAQALKKKSDPAAKAARRDAASYKTSDDSHLDSKPKAPEKKRGRGEKDLPHIVSQLRGVVDTKDGKPSAVKFKDGTTKNVKPKHAAAWLKKHDSAKPHQKLDMYKSHDSHDSFKSYAKEEIEEAKVKNCGCDKDPCETYGSKEQQMQEAGRWDQTSSGRAYRKLSPEEKARRARANMIARRAKAMKGDEDYVSKGTMRKPTLGGAKSVYKGRKTRKEEVLIDYLEAFAEEKMIGHEYQQQLKRHGKMDPNVKKAVTSVYDKKPVDKKYANDPQVKKAQRYMKIEAVVEASYQDVLKKRYSSYHPDDNPQATRKLKPGEHSQPKGANVYKMHPGAKLTDRGYSKKGKMAAIKKQLQRRPEQYGVTSGLPNKKDK